MQTLHPLSFSLLSSALSTDPPLFSLTPATVDPFFCLTLLSFSLSLSLSCRTRAFHCVLLALLTSCFTFGVHMYAHGSRHRVLCPHSLSLSLPLSVSALPACLGQKSCCLCKQLVHATAGETESRTRGCCCSRYSFLSLFSRTRVAGSRLRSFTVIGDHSHIMRK